MKSFVLLFVAAGLFINANLVSAVTTNIFFTQFEQGEGYNTNFDLVGQAGWTGQGSGGNGVLANGITGQGHSAYIGYDAPNPTNDSLVVWHPINFNPSASGFPVVKFSVLMNIQDSINGQYDIFRWSIYNNQVDRLFSIDFDNDFLDISYWLDGTNPVVFTGLQFTNDINYTLNVTMNFAANRWSATYNNILIATNQPITTTSAPLNLGDVDAVWLVNQIPYTNGLGQIITTNAPGDNYMLFDNYRITAETLPVTPAQVQFLGRSGDGSAILRVFGEDGSRWALETTTNFLNWTAVKTNPISGTYYDQVDTTAAGSPRRFYRARFVP